MAFWNTNLSFETDKKCVCSAKNMFLGINLCFKQIFRDRNMITEENILPDITAYYRDMIKKFSKHCNFSKVAGFILN